MHKASFGWCVTIKLLNCFNSYVQIVPKRPKSSRLEFGPILLHVDGKNATKILKIFFSFLRWKSSTSEFVFKRSLILLAQQTISYVWLVVCHTF